MIKNGFDSDSQVGVNFFEMGSGRKPEIVLKGKMRINTILGHFRNSHALDLNSSAKLCPGFGFDRAITKY